MKIYKKPNPDLWSNLMKRPYFQSEDLTTKVQFILKEVKQKGDEALVKFTQAYDQVHLNDLKVSPLEFEDAQNQVPERLKQAISIAAENIRKFHASQKLNEPIIETTQGVNCWRKAIPIEKVGIYIPGGTAPLFSTILMLAIPAQIAGCKTIVMCTPTDREGNVNPIVLYVANYLGIKNIFKVGGAQAIAAMGYGTESIPKVDKIFGPGNQFVTKSKELIQQDGVAIDMPAGPSEVLVIADEFADVDFVAADLLAQAEHGIDSQVILLTNSNQFIEKVRLAIDQQLKELPRQEITAKALKNSLLIELNSLEECFDWSNRYAPEHLILNLKNAENYIDSIQNAGSVFVGPYTCESAGDYASGTNHTLPTNGFARNYSGISLDSFVKKITFQSITEKGLKNLGPTIELMAEAEQLQAHKNAVSIRLQKLMQNEI
jgi:histidinol dehydrogenase